MTSSQMLIVRVAEEDLEKLDRLAVLQGTARSQLVQEALSDLLSGGLKTASEQRSVTADQLAKDIG